jgi:DHA1 family multidrug resistance protein-like MFS transporter
MSDTTNLTDIHDKETSNNNPSDDTNDVEEFRPTVRSDLELQSEMANYELERIDSSTAASQVLSRKVTGADKFFEEANNTDEPLPLMGGGRDYPPPMPDRGPYQVMFDGPDDPLNPQNWSLGKKILMCFSVGLAAISISSGSAMFAASAPDLMEIYHIGWTPATLGTSLFVLGFASGPIIWGPLSELYGRKIVLVCSTFGYTCFSFAVAVSKDIQSVMICRFFAGFIGASPLVVAPAAFADMFNARTRGTAIALFVVCIFAGPMVSPILGGFTVKNSTLGWRWLSYFIGIIGALSFVAIVFFFEETYAPLVLMGKAEKLRRRTGNWGIYAPHEEFRLTLKEIVEKNITRPIYMLFTEPILFFVTLYNAFVYGILYLFLTAVPLIFSGQYGWSSGVGELPYLSMLIGIFIGTMIAVYYEFRFNKLMDEKGGFLDPEDKLPTMVIGGISFCIGIFWLGWTGAFGDRIHWIVPTIGAAPIGIGLVLIFLPCLSYIIDCYLIYAASAIAGNTFLRSAFGAIFPLFARQMMVNMKIQYACTLLGAVAAVLIPVPLLFMKFGGRLRKRSKYATDLRDLMAQK